jgi:hypothetical protein
MGSEFGSGVEGKWNWLNWEEDELESRRGDAALAAESGAESKRVEAADTKTEMGIDAREEAGE